MTSDSGGRSDLYSGHGALDTWGGGLYSRHSGLYTTGCRHISAGCCHVSLGGFDSSLGRLPDPSVGGISTLRHRDRPAVKTAAPAQLMPPAL